MNDEQGLGFWTWRLLIGFSLVFAGLLFYSLFDLFYLLLGSEGQATITETYKMDARRGADRTVIEYTFNSGGTERKGKTNLGVVEFTPSPGEQFAIQYLPGWFPAGPDGARPKRPFNWTVLGLLLLSSTGLGLFIYRAIQDSGSETPRQSIRGRK